MTQDTKMIIGVAVLVIAGAAGLAALGVLGTRQEPERNQAGERRVVTALPASHKEERPVIQTAVTEVEPFFPEIPRIEPVVPICDALGDTGRIAKGLEHWETGAYGVAAACFGDEAAAGSQRPWVHYMLGLSLWKDGSLDRAAEAMTRAGELDDQSIKTCVNLSRIQNDRGAYDEALVAARQALAIEPDNPKAMFLEGRSLRNQGVRDEALQVLRRSVELDPNNGHALNLLGLTLLYFGAEWLVKGSSEIALKVGISPLVVGLTVVAFGTSAPELLVSLKANMSTPPKGDIALGNIVGSNICNIALILGVGALIRPITVHAQILKREIHWGTTWPDESRNGTRRMDAYSVPLIASSRSLQRVPSASGMRRVTTMIRGSISSPCSCRLRHISCSRARTWSRM